MNLITKIHIDCDDFILFYVLNEIISNIFCTATFKEPGSLEEFQPPQDFTISHQVTEPNMVDEIYRSIVMNNGKFIIIFIIGFYRISCLTRDIGLYCRCSISLNYICIST